MAFTIPELSYTFSEYLLIPEATRRRTVSLGFARTPLTRFRRVRSLPFL